MSNLCHWKYHSILLKEPSLVELNQVQIDYALAEAAKRQKHHPQLPNESDALYARKVEDGRVGCLGEMAMSVLTGLPMPVCSDPPWPGYDYIMLHWKVEVKTITFKNGDLLVPRFQEKNGAEIYCLIEKLWDTEMSRYLYRGYAFRHEVFKKEYLTNMRGGVEKNTYQVPSSVLKFGFPFCTREEYATSTAKLLELGLQHY